MPAITSTKKECIKSGMTTPSVFVRRSVRLRATAFGWNPSSATLARTRARVAAPMSFRLLRTLETVVIDTPSSPAIRFMVGGIATPVEGAPLPIK
jgi:hypothetical protein